MRALRATLVVPAMFALTLKGIGDTQIALFAVFGAFATLVMASFSGSAKDKLVAHLGLAVAGSVALTIGTLVSGTTVLAALVTVPVAFAIFFGGVVSPNAASGVTAALLAYVLPVASAGTASDIPARLAGWWLAAAVSTAAVLLLSPSEPSGKLTRAAARCARALAAPLSAGLRGEPAPALREASVAAKHDLLTAFSAASYRPTGLATADQALANVVQLLEWCATLVFDALDEDLRLSEAAPPDRELVSAAASALTCVADLFDGRETEPDLAWLNRARFASVAHQRELSGDPERLRRDSAYAFHAQVIAIAAQAAAIDALIAVRRADPETVDAERRRWFGAPRAGAARGGRWGTLAAAAGFVARHASMRSVWFRNSARGAVALAAAVAVADLTGVQHGFWVVLGTLSVLRTNAASTGSTAWRALLGTAVGFAAGAALMLAIGTGQTALWVALPLAVLVASYAPGTAPFAVGQAAFTVTIVVLFNLLVPAGWKVGLLRIEDVAMGCAVSLGVGLLFWPRGASAVVGDDLADAFRHGSSYLRQAVDWSLRLRPSPPDQAVAAVTAGIRLDDAVRGYLAEQGAKRLPKEDLWRLVMGTMRIRLTALSMAGLPGTGAEGGPDAPGLAPRGIVSADPVSADAVPAGAASSGAASPGAAFPGAPPSGAGHPGGGLNPAHLDRARDTLRHMAAELAGYYDLVADQVGPPTRADVTPVPAPVLSTAGPEGPTPAHYHPHVFWVGEHLKHLAEHAYLISVPAARLARMRRAHWWR
jgi:uncharacterized membrane protein YccC